jgi:hypothetical protein
MKQVSVISSVAALLCLAFTCIEACAQQVSDPDFDTKVARPAYTKERPRVLFDEAHVNFHTSSGRYKPFADLISSDGYDVSPIRELLSHRTLTGSRILVIANALGAESAGHREWSPDWIKSGSASAFNDNECDVIRDWVQQGGGLLLISDHSPFGAAVDTLARRFGVEMSKGYVFDKANIDERGIYRNDLTFTRKDGGIAEHAITRGRNEGEVINRVMTFVGQSLKGPAGSVPLLRFSDTAVDRADVAMTTREDSAAGRAQAIAFRFGKGRVVMLGEAAMLSAQTSGSGGKDSPKFGMNVPGIDNRQLALNIMHWLSGLLD